jgi:hypothetical protein
MKKGRERCPWISVAGAPPSICRFAALDNQNNQNGNSSSSDVYIKCIQIYPIFNFLIE